MMANIGEVQPRHYPQILRDNARFVHWLSPLDEEGLIRLLGIATFARQVDDGAGVLIAYHHAVDYDHKNLKWLRARFDNFYYIDRITISESAHGKGYGRALYTALEAHARAQGFKRLVCEVNTKPDNPGSHKFHERYGFRAVGDMDYPDYNASVRYYEKTL